MRTQRYRALADLRCLAGRTSQRTLTTGQQWYWYAFVKMSCYQRLLESTDPSESPKYTQLNQWTSRKKKTCLRSRCAVFVKSLQGEGNSERLPMLLDNLTLEMWVTFAWKSPVNRNQYRRLLRRLSASRYVTSLLLRTCSIIFQSMNMIKMFL